MRIGVTVLTREGQNIWENGLGQNAVFLAQALRALPQVESVVFVDCGNKGELPSQVDRTRVPFSVVQPREATARIDALIEVSGAASDEWLRHLRALGKPVIWYCGGHPYCSLAESTIFDKASAAVLEPQRWDQIWLPLQYAQFTSFLRTWFRTPVSPAPYIWAPMFLQGRMRELENAQRHFGWPLSDEQQPAGPLRLAIFEPNISVAKALSIPMLACDLAYRQRPGAIASMAVLNSVHMKDHTTLLYLANSLDLVRHHKAMFTGRHDFAGFMCENADVVVAHQWSNEQNYLYLDALYGGYPLVHNSPWLRDMGYYYPGFSATEAAARILHVAAHFREEAVSYRSRARTFFETLRPEAPANLRAFGELLERAFAVAPALSRMAP